MSPAHLEATLATTTQSRPRRRHLHHRRPKATKAATAPPRPDTTAHRRPSLAMATKTTPARPHRTRPVTAQRAATPMIRPNHHHRRRRRETNITERQ